MLGFALDTTVHRGGAHRSLRIAGPGGLTRRIAFSRAGPATAMNAQGVMTDWPADIPRPAHDPQTGQRVGTLIEGAATNIVPHSAASRTAWPNFGAHLTDLALGALGRFPGVRVASQGSFSDRINTPAIPLSAGQDYAIRLYLRAGSSPSARLIIRAAGGAFSRLGGPPDAMGTVADFAGPLVTLGQVTLPDATIMCDVRFTPLTSDIYDMGVGPDSALAGEDLIVLGLQCEAGPRPTSYIATDGAPATRPADQAAITGIGGQFDLHVNDGTGAWTRLEALTVGEGYWPALTGSVLSDMVLLRR